MVIHGKETGLRTSTRSFGFLVVLVCCGGAQCLPRGPTAPVLLSDAPRLSDVMTVVNQNTDRVQSLLTNDATINVAGLPRLRANIAYERPHRFRLRATSIASTPELDIGSNDESFWFWIKRGQPPALYFAKHDRWTTNPSRAAIPIEPQWIIQALGLAHLDPSSQHSDPIRTANGDWVIRSVSRSASGTRVMLTVVDRHGWVLQQHMETADGRRLASSVATGHRPDPATQVALPQRIEVQIPGQPRLSIDLGHCLVNPQIQPGEHLWTRPHYPGYAEVDLADADGIMALPEVAPPRRMAPQPSSAGRGRDWRDSRWHRY